MPDPYQGETDGQRAERMLGYVRLAPTATTDGERAVILGLRAAHFRGAGQVEGRVFDYVAQLYADVMAKLA